MGLLDDILDDHKVVREEKKEKEREFLDKLKETPAHAEVPQDALPIETERATWFGDPDHTLCGMSPGDRFEMSDCGPELDGVWVVAKVQRPRHREEPCLFAARESGGPPYARLEESVIREEIELGRLRPLKKEIPQG